MMSSMDYLLYLLGKFCLFGGGGGECMYILVDFCLLFFLRLLIFLVLILYVIVI